MAVRAADIADVRRMAAMADASDLSVLESIEEVIAFTVAQARAAGDDECDAAELLVRVAELPPAAVRRAEGILRRLGYPTGNTFHRPNLGDRRLTERPACRFPGESVFRFRVFIFLNFFPRASSPKDPTAPTSDSDGTQRGRLSGWGPTSESNVGCLHRPEGGLPSDEPRSASSSLRRPRHYYFLNPRGRSRDHVYSGEGLLGCGSSSDRATVSPPPACSSAPPNRSWSRSSAIRTRKRTEQIRFPNLKFRLLIFGEVILRDITSHQIEAACDECVSAPGFPDGARFDPPRTALGRPSGAAWIRGFVELSRRCQRPGDMWRAPAGFVKTRLLA
jgi:hypothetical protein